MIVKRTNKQQLTSTAEKKMCITKYSRPITMSRTVINENIKRYPSSCIDQCIAYKKRNQKNKKKLPEGVTIRYPYLVFNNLDQDIGLVFFLQQGGSATK